MSAAGITCFAAAITCASRGLPPTWCSTLGSFDLSRVPLPAAMIATAVRAAAWGRFVAVWMDFDACFFLLFKYTPCGLPSPGEVEAEQRSYPQTRRNVSR